MPAFFDTFRAPVSSLRSSWANSWQTYAATTCRNHTYFTEVDESFIKVDGKFFKVDGKFFKVDGKFFKVWKKFNKVLEKFDKPPPYLFKVRDVMVRADGILLELRAFVPTFTGGLCSPAKNLGKERLRVCEVFGFRFRFFPEVLGSSLWLTVFPTEVDRTGL
ncbi:hypothetical protein [Geomonas azotofigens]|uniref:hypothetical protein n=1 Tax=Geomonas azotofigens TaxID=2843196 RepID=UPI001C0F5D81|nr:hypothetical protein [Geomonas azotofigens]MBU5614707.1 hypothetical protein [Geomonas azotofigens]